MKYAIFGATGAVGKSLARELARSGESFRVVGRSLETLQKEFGPYAPRVENVVADLADPAAAKTAARGVETIFYTAGVPYTRFADHPVLMRNTIEAAVAEGVRHLVHVATVYPFGRARTALVNEDHPREPHTFKGRMRKEQEDLVLAANGRGGLRTTLLRAPDFYGADSELSYVASIFKAAVSGGRANVIGPIDEPHEFVYVPDLARTLVQLSRENAAYGHAWNLAGPGQITERDFMQRVFNAAGRKPRFMVAGPLMMKVAGLFNPMAREVAEMQYLFSQPLMLDDARLRALLPNLTKTSYDEGIRETVEELKARESGTR